MSKASAAIRRSGVRLRSLGSGHTHLKLLISDQSSTRQRYKDLLATQTSTSDRLDRWSQAEDSPAIQDVLHQTHELNTMWIEAQREFVVALKEYKRVYENILAVEKKLDLAKKHLSACEEKEKKLKKELSKGPKDVPVTQDKLRQATDSVQLAEAEVVGQKRETDAVKLISVRAGMMDLSQNWENMGKKCMLLAQAQKELAELMPDIGSSRIQEIPAYNCGRDSTRILMGIRTKMDQLGGVSTYALASATSLTLPTRERHHSGATEPVASRSLTRLPTKEQIQAEDSFEDDSYDEYD